MADCHSTGMPSPWHRCMLHGSITLWRTTRHWCWVIEPSQLPLAAKKHHSRRLLAAACSGRSATDQHQRQRQQKHNKGVSTMNRTCPCRCQRHRSTTTTIESALSPYMKVMQCMPRRRTKCCCCLPCLRHYWQCWCHLPASVS